MKMNRIEKAVKGLQRELEVEEGEQRSTGELVLVSSWVRFFNSGYLKTNLVELSKY